MVGLEKTRNVERAYGTSSSRMRLGNIFLQHHYRTIICRERREKRCKMLLLVVIVVVVAHRKIVRELKEGWQRERDEMQRMEKYKAFFFQENFDNFLGLKFHKHVEKFQGLKSLIIK